jgi:hypothetical protein
VVLGNETTLNLDLFDATPYLLLIVENEEMEPRVPLTAVPYAMKSYRLDAAALRAGQNVEINRLSDGSLQIGSTGGGTGGLTSVASDATLTGNGTSSSPLGLADGSVTGSKLANNALLAGANVDIVRRGNGSLEISTTGGGGGGGLTQVASDATLSGDGTAGSPLGLANGSVTGVKVADGAVTGVKLVDGSVAGVKLADGALVAGSNVTITRQAGGAFEVASAGGGISAVASDATLTGNGTAGTPLAVSVPLELIGSASTGVIRGENASGNFGYIGGTYGVYGFSTSSIAVHGRSINSHGVYGFSNNSLGVFGQSNDNNGVRGSSVSDFGVRGQNGNNWGALGGSTYGVFGVGASSGFAAGFSGDVTIIGNLVKSSGSFKIDHPLDPANKYLVHSFVESPDMMNVYNGNVTTDANGEATVTLPDYFEALNRDFRYQLTTIGGFAPVYIAEKILGNSFKIAGGKPGMEVSWQVTGIRQDAWAEEHRIVVEEDKPASEQGFYLHPKLFGQPEERSLWWAQDPEGMRARQQRHTRLNDEHQRLPRQP